MSKDVYDIKKSLYDILKQNYKFIIFTSKEYYNYYQYLKKTEKEFADLSKNTIAIEKNKINCMKNEIKKNLERNNKVGIIELYTKDNIVMETIIRNIFDKDKNFYIEENIDNIYFESFYDVNEQQHSFMPEIEKYKHLFIENSNCFNIGHNSLLLEYKIKKILLDFFKKKAPISVIQLDNYSCVIKKNNFKENEEKTDDEQIIIKNNIDIPLIVDGAIIINEEKEQTVISSLVLLEKLKYDEIDDIFNNILNISELSNVNIEVYDYNDKYNFINYVMSYIQYLEFYSTKLNNDSIDNNSFDTLTSNEKYIFNKVKEKISNKDVRKKLLNKLLDVRNNITCNKEFDIEDNNKNIEEILCDKETKIFNEKTMIDESKIYIYINRYSFFDEIVKYLQNGYIDIKSNNINNSIETVICANNLICKINDNKIEDILNYIIKVQENAINNSQNLDEKTDKFIRLLQELSLISQEQMNALSFVKVRQRHSSYNLYKYICIFDSNKENRVLEAAYNYFYTNDNKYLKIIEFYKLEELHDKIKEDKFIENYCISNNDNSKVKKLVPNNKK